MHSSPRNDREVARWRRHAEQHTMAARMAREVGYEHADLRRSFDMAVDEGRPRYEQAVQQGDAAAAIQIYAGYRAEAVGMATGTAARISGI